MDMDTLINNPVITEVLNIVNESPFSIDISVIDLSTTFQTFFESQTFHPNNVMNRITKNIKNFGSSVQTN